MHLTADELIDLAEGARPESSAPHLAACETCRSQLSDLRATMSAAADAGVPEPSPLFWDHFSARVRDAVAAESSPGRLWLEAFLRPGILAPVSVAAAAVVLTGLLLRAPPPSLPSSPPMGPTAVAAPAVPGDRDGDLLGDAIATADDPSLILVADLTVDMDWETAHAAGLATPGSAEHAVTHLSDGELRALQRLLQEALARRGA